MRRAAPALLALLALAGAAAAVQPATSGQGQGEFTLEPQQLFHPVATSLAQGDAIAFDWRVTDPPGARLFFSQHLHVAAQQLNITDTTATALASSLVAENPGQYSILWENHGTEAVTFVYEYHTVRATAAPAQAPFPAALAPAALAGAALLAARARRG